MMLSENKSWSTREIRRLGRPIVDWLRLGVFGDPEVTVGVLKDGSWVVDTADGLADLDDARALTLAFPILNSSIHEIRDRFTEIEGSLENAVWRDFPWTRLVVHAISRGGYWAEQSLPWLTEIELDNGARKAVIDGLMAIENNKDFSQELRHKVKRQRRQMEQSSR